MRAGACRANPDATPSNLKDFLSSLARTSAQCRAIDNGEIKMRMVQNFLKDESGATAIEYGLIAAGISVAIIAVVQGLGTKLKSTFTAVSGALN